MFSLVLSSERLVVTSPEAETVPSAAFFPEISPPMLSVVPVFRVPRRLQSRSTGKGDRPGSVEPCGSEPGKDSQVEATAWAALFSLS
ncbi:hypothetical protein ABZ318_25885 [Streptomyces sp. NPDC006197]|uniref:hypothetical protein n=1 Tax=Streptomyces sp. NPDC006197 TaxID=3156685 RepID=UPI0033BA9545